MLSLRKTQRNMTTDGILARAKHQFSVFNFLQLQTTKLYTSGLERNSRLLISSTAKNAGWMFLGQGLSFLFQAGYFILLARLLGAKEYGVYAGAFALTSLVARCSTLGTGTVLLRHVSGSSAVFREYWGNVLLTTFGINVVAIPVLQLAGPHLISSGGARLLLLAALTNCLFGQLVYEASRVFQTFERMRATAILTIATNCARAVVAACMFLDLHHASAQQWAAASAIISAIAAVISILTVTRYFGWPRFDLRVSIKHFWEGAEFTFASSTSSVYNDFDKAMLSHYGMSVANGIYTMAYRVLEIATMPIYSIKDAMLPKLFGFGQSGIVKVYESSRHILKKTILIGAGFSVVLFLASPLLATIVGKGFAETANALRWLAIIPLCRSIHVMCGWNLTCAGYQRYRTSSQVIIAGINVVLNLLFIGRYGWLGAAWASVISDSLLAVLTFGAQQYLLRSARSSVRSHGGSSTSHTMLIAHKHGSPI